jgi:dUTP pyrophosphatase
MIDVKFKKLSEDAIPFKYSREYDACMDMYANVDTLLKTGETKIIPTGIALEIPVGYEGVVRGRSGLASKGVYVHVGTIDETYRGDVGAVLHNLGDNDLQITKGMRIAQITIKETQRVNMIEADNLSHTDRGTNGYGSSGY